MEWNSYSQPVLGTAREKSNWEVNFRLFLQSRPSKAIIIIEILYKLLPQVPKVFSKLQKACIFNK